MMTLLWLVPLVVAASALLTGALYRYALAHQVIDMPNERSSHTIPTPRGGGMAIVVSCLSAVLFVAARGMLPWPVAIAIVGTGTIAAIVGFLDDHGSIGVGLRLATHFGAAAWGLAWLGGFGPLAIAGSVVDLGWIGNLLALLGVVWMLNLYNFMDGIDGLAGLEAVTTGCGAMVLCSLASSGDLAGPGWVGGLLSAAAAGFLLWNWPPARIFMGDGGSGAIGAVLALLAVAAGHIDPQYFWVWMILLGVFVVDSTVTLLRRVFRGERAFSAHRDHAYQSAAVRYGHRAVTLTVAAINLFWLLPIATAVALHLIDGAVSLVIAYAPLFYIVRRTSKEGWGKAPYRSYPY